MLDFKPTIRQTIIDTGVKITPTDIEKITEAIDIQLDRTIPNSIFNKIVNAALSDITLKLTKLRTDLR